MDLEHGLMSLVTAIYYCINKTLLISFFVHRRTSQDCFRIVIMSKTESCVVHVCMKFQGFPKIRHFPVCTNGGFCNVIPL